jgi:hypothetical protein
MPPAVAPPKSCPGCRELVEARTPRSRTYVSREGRRFVALFPASVNYRNADGALAAMDNTLVPNGAGGWRNKENDYRVDLPSALEAPVKVSRGQAWVSLSLQGARGSGSVRANTATYTGVLPGVDVAYEAGNEMVKDTLTLAGPASPTTFTYSLAMSSGLEARPANGGLALVSPTGEVAFHIAPPFMKDAAHQTSTAVSMTASPGPGGLTLTVRADGAWLARPERRWPVMVDPFVRIQNPPQTDCFVRNDYPDSSYCSTDATEVQSQNGLESRGLLRFDGLAEAVPYDAVVMNAELGLHLSYRAGADTPAPVNLHRLTRGFSGAVTWNRYDGTNPWTAAGGDYEPAAAAAHDVQWVGYWQRFYLTKLVQDWVSGAVPNHGVLVRRAVQGDQLSFTSWNSTTDTGNWPYLWVAYEPRTGPRSSTVLDQRVTDRVSLGVNPASGNLMVRTRAIQGKGTGLDLTADFGFDGIGGSYNRPHWTYHTDASLSVFGDGSLGYYGPEGPVGAFVPSGSGFTSPPGANATMTKTSDTTYELVFNADGRKYRFDMLETSDTAFLMAEIDRNGNIISYQREWMMHDPSREVVAMVDTQGRTATVGYYGDQPESFTDSAGRVARYGYDAGSCCAVRSFTDPSGEGHQLRLRCSGPAEQGHRSQGQRHLGGVRRQQPGELAQPPDRSSQLGRLHLELRLLPGLGCRPQLGPHRDHRSPFQEGHLHLRCR